MLAADHDYDPNGNRTRLEDPSTGEVVTATYDAQDRLVAYGSASYSWDENGSLLNRTSPEGTNG